MALAAPPGTPNTEPATISAVAAMCALLGVAPGVLLTFLGLRAHRNAAKLEAVATFVKVYGRIGLNDLAAKLGKTRAETETFVMDAVERGLLVGFIDRTTDEFVLSESLWFQQPTARVCPQCGATVQQVYLTGETARCPYCMSVLPDEPPPSRQP